MKFICSLTFHLFVPGEGTRDLSKTPKPGVVPGLSGPTQTAGSPLGAANQRIPAVGGKTSATSAYGPLPSPVKSGLPSSQSTNSSTPRSSPNSNTNHSSTPGSSVGSSVPPTTSNLPGLFQNGPHGYSRPFADDSESDLDEPTAEDMANEAEIDAARAREKVFRARKIHPIASQKKTVGR